MNGRCIALFQNWHGLAAGTLSRCLCFLALRGLLGWTSNFIASSTVPSYNVFHTSRSAFSCCRWEMRVSDSFAASTRWHCLGCKKMSEEAVFGVHNRYLCDDDVKRLDWKQVAPGFAILINFQIFRSRHYNCEGKLECVQRIGTTCPSRITERLTFWFCCSCQF